jgi:hypothetical protein
MPTFGGLSCGADEQRNARNTAGEQAVRALMARYFFHTEDGLRLPDDEGVDLPDLAAVRAEAVGVLADLLRDNAQEVLKTGLLRIVVTDARQATVFVLAVSATDGEA